MIFNSLVKGAVVAAAFALSLSGAQAVTFHSFNGSEPASLDPHRISGDWENRIVGDFIEGLMTEDENAQAILGQAASYTVSDDGTVYTFTLRDGITWTDGTPVTAGDFEFAFKRLLDPAMASGYAYLQYPIKNAESINAGDLTDFGALGVKALDDKTLEITLEQPTPYLLQALTHYTAYPVPQHLVEKLGDDWTDVENIVANGPYKITEWVPGSHVLAVKNDMYYDAANVQIDEVKYYIMDDIQAALQRYRAGEFDVMTDFPADQLSLLESQYPGQAKVDPYLGVYYYVMNQTKPEFQDINVRKALSIAINRKVIGPDVLGTGELPAYGWVPPGTANYEGEAYMPAWADQPYGERVAEATALMEAAGYSKDNPLEIELSYNTNENHKRVAVAIAAMWEPIHVKVDLFNSETPVHYDALQEGSFSGVGRAGWLMDYNDPINMLELMRSDINYNYGRFSNADFDALLRKSATIQDVVERAKVLHEAEAIAMDNFGVLPIYYYVSKNVVSPKISGYTSNANDIHRTRWVTKAE